MITKKYKANSLTEAIEKIRTDLGAKASIVQTKRIPAKKTLFGTKPGVVEVTAAVNENDLTQEKLDKLSGFTKTKIEPKNLRKGSEPLWKSPEPRTATSAALPNKDDLEELLRENEDLTKMVNELRKERQKYLSSGIKATKLSTTSMSSTPMDPILTKQGVNAEVLRQWQNHHQGLSEDLRPEEVLESCANYFLDQFANCDVDLPRVFSVVGTAGSGKTSMVLKLAHHLKQMGKKVAVFSLDGSMDATMQMKHFSSSVDIPFCVIYQIRTYRNAIKEFSDYDHIIIDTYSVSPSEKSRIDALQKRLQKMDCDTYAVFSAKDVDNEWALQMYRNFNIRGLMFTKLDELNKVGQVFNFLVKTDLPLSYFGIGRKLEEDIEEATVERLVSILFNIEEETNEVDVDVQPTDFKPLLM